MADSATRRSPRKAIRTAVVWRYLAAALDDQIAATGRSRLDVVDAGGGTGGFAVPLAELGHHVTVVDPSPDALAALERRASEAGVTDRIRPAQGDPGELLDIVPTQSADAVLYHGVLEIADDPREVLAVASDALRLGGVLSILVANRHAVVLSRALGGHFTEARHALDDPAGRWGAGDPVPRRFALDDLLRLIETTDLAVTAVHGARAFSDLVPGTFTDEPGALDALLDLESAVAEHPAFLAVATQVHVLAQRA